MSDHPQQTEAMRLSERLRDACNGIRRTSVPLSDLIPLLQKSADALAQPAQAPQPEAQAVAFEFDADDLVPHADAHAESISENGEWTFDVTGLYQVVRDFIDARLATQQPAPSAEAGQWLPIETAPKDGSKVMLWWAHPTKDQPGAAIGRWLDNSKTATPWAGWSLPKVIVPGMYASRWMPLPAAPTTTSTGGDK